MAVAAPSEQNDHRYRVVNTHTIAQSGRHIASAIQRYGMFSSIKRSVDIEFIKNISEPMSIATKDTTVATASLGLVASAFALAAYPIMRIIELSTHARLRKFLQQDIDDEKLAIKKIRRYTRFNRRYLRHPEDMAVLLTALNHLSVDAIAAIITDRPDLLSEISKDQQIINKLFLTRDEWAEVAVLFPDDYRSNEMKIAELLSKEETELEQAIIELKPKLRAYLLILQNAKRNESLSQVLHQTVLQRHPHLYITTASHRFESTLFSPALGLRHVFQWDLRLFLGAASFSVLGALIGSFIFPGLGTAIGGLIGLIGGGGFSLFRHKILTLKPFRYIAHRVKTHKGMGYERELFRESKYDIPFEANLFSGLTLGMVIGSVIPGFGTAIGGLIGVVVGGFASTMIPVAFAGLRRLFRIQPRRRFDDGIKWQRSFYGESTWDIPFLARTLFGAVSGVALGGFIGSIIPGIGTAIGAIIGLVVTATAGFASPFVAALLRKIIKPRPARAFDYLSANWKTRAIHRANETSFDLPWLLRLVPGTSAGAGIGAAIGTLIFPGIGSALGGAIGGILGGGFALLHPMIRTLYALIREKISPLRQDETYTKKMPYFIPLFGGVGAGSLICAAVGTLILPGVGTTIGAAVGALAGGAIAMAHPFIRNLGYAIYHKIKKTPKKQVESISSSESDSEISTETIDMTGESTESQDLKLENTPKAKKFVTIKSSQIDETQEEEPCQLSP